MIPRQLLEQCADQIEKSATQVFEESDPYVAGEAIFQWLRKNNI